MISNDNERIKAMTEGGEKLGEILKNLLNESVTGTNLLDIEDHANDLIKKAGGSPSFTTVEDYKWATCLCVNDEVVHGIPKKYLLQKDDVFTIDIGMIYKGYHTDMARTKIIGIDKDEVSDKKHFLDTGKKALNLATSAAVVGNRIGHISSIIEDIITEQKYGIVRSLVGHGVGKKLHEEPQIPGFVRGDIKNTPLIKEGMTLAIEVIYAKGNGSIVIDNDGWTIRTRDGSLSAVFENTISVNINGPRVLTVCPF
jgi:methionyl aminopeptidase